MSDLGQQLAITSDERRSYVLQHLPGHLTNLHEAERLYSLLTDIFFLEAKTQGVSVFDLAADFTRAVEVIPDDHPHHKIFRLLEEAIRRDIDFINRHRKDYPQALFQCLWNSCWWYDCPEAAEHYEQGAQDQPDGSAAEGYNKPNIFQLAEQWLIEKQKDSPGMLWCRSLRPPPLHLGTSQRTVLQGHTSLVSSIAVSLDGTRMASVSWDNSAKIWNVISGEIEFNMEGHKSILNSVAFSPDGRCIVTGSSDLVARQVDIYKRRQVSCFVGHQREPHRYAKDQELSAVAFAPDGRRAASASSNGFVRIWETDKCKELLSLDHEYIVTDVVFLANDRIATACRDGVIRIWNLAKGDKVLAISYPSQSSLQCIAYDLNTEVVAAGAADGTFGIWSIKDGHLLLHVRAHEGRWLNGVNDISFSSTGRLIATASSDRTARLFDMKTGRHLASFEGHASYVESVCFTPDDQWLVTGSWDRTVRIWNVNARSNVRHLLGHDGKIWSIQFSSNGRRIVSRSRGGSEQKRERDRLVRVWDADNGRCRCCLRGYDAFVRDVAISHDGQLAATAANDCTVRIWDTNNDREIRCLAGHQGAVNVVAFSQDSRWVVSGSESDKTIRLWNWSSHRRPAGLWSYEAGVWGVGFFPDGRQVLAVLLDNTLRIIDISSRREMAICRGHTDKIEQFAFSPDERRLASGAEDGTVRVWDARSGEQLLCLPEHEGDGVDDVAFSPTGDRIASRSYHSTIRVWDGSTGKCLQTIKGNTDAISLLGGPETYPYIAISNKIETEIRDSSTGRTAGWFPVHFYPLVSRPRDPVWAGAADDEFMWIFRLEGTRLRDDRSQI